MLSPGRGPQTWPKHQLHGCGNFWILLRGDALNLSAVQFGHFGAFHPTFKGSECSYRFFGLRVLHTTRHRGPVHHRPAGDEVEPQRTARPLAHLSTIGPRLLV